MKKNRLQPVEPAGLSRGRKALFWLLAAGIAVVSTLAGAEILIRIIAPQEIMFPRWEYSARYGSVFPPQTVVTHQCPGRWRFVYTTNRFGNRGEAIEIEESAEKRNIVVLGDSFSFGTGVNDGEEYPAVLGRKLGGGYNVINISLAGWGLTQQLRRYHDFGRSYRPETVILQFSANDLLDNFVNRVADVAEGQLYYRNTDRTKSRRQVWISRCYLLQKSQTYALARNLISRELWRRRDEEEELLGRSAAVPAHEKFHADLLESFSRELREEGIRLILTGPEDSIYWFPYLSRRIEELESEGLLEYHPVGPWLEGVEDFGSPEGHSWGTKAHRIIGVRLAEIIREEF